MEDCLFCKIVKGEIPSKKVYDDDLVFVFLDINPNTNGDLLIIPKKHYVSILDIDNETLIHMFNVVRDSIIPLVRERLGATGLTITQNNGTGQDVKHFHIHLTSRYEEDNLKISSNKDILLGLDEVYNKLMEN